MNNPICRHCKRSFKYDPAKHNQATCDSEECRELEDIRRRKLKSQLTMKRRKQQANGEAIRKEEIYGTKPCPRCGGMMELHNRYRCNNCWRVVQAGGPSTFEQYGMVAQG